VAILLRIARRLSGGGLAVRTATFGRVQFAFNQSAGELMAGIVSANEAESAITFR